jgi:uncharacterized membrane protein YbaN (DUF454 family)
MADWRGGAQATTLAPMTARPPPPRRLSRPIRWALDGLGGGLVAIGAVGVVTPGLPTTVFWIGAVLCFLKTRPHAVRPLLRTPIIGPAILWYLRWRPFGGSRKRRRAPI